MESVLDKTARATTDRKALSALTETAAPLHPWSQAGKYLELSIPSIRSNLMVRAPTAMTWDVASFTLLFSVPASARCVTSR